MTRRVFLQGHFSKGGKASKGDKHSKHHSGHHKSGKKGGKGHKKGSKAGFGKGHSKKVLTSFSATITYKNNVE